MFFNPTLPGYDIQRKIGEGKFGKVYLTEEQKTSKLFACKVIEMKIDSNQFRSEEEAVFALQENFDTVNAELHVLRKLDHENTIKLFDV